jgi:tRNA threonylcarbamoyladenosine biosynthesis protein TsaB
MTILALDFSSPQRSIAVWRGGSSAPCEVVDASGGRTLRPMAMVAEALRGAGVEPGAVEGLAVGLGPGSYTGIRVAISVAQGWQLARAVKLLGLSTADVIAAGLVEAGVRGPASVVIDAQRGEFYLADYTLGEAAATNTAPLRLATLAEVTARAAAGDLLAGPEVTRWFPAGRLAFPRAAVLARLAAPRTDFLAGELLEPIYLRETTFVKAPPSRTVPPISPCP